VPRPHPGRVATKRRVRSFLLKRWYLWLRQNISYLCLLVIMVLSIVFVMDILATWVIQDQGRFGNSRWVRVPAWDFLQFYRNHNAQEEPFLPYGHGQTDERIAVSSLNAACLTPLVEGAQITVSTYTLTSILAIKVKGQGQISITYNHL